MYYRPLASFAEGFQTETGYNLQGRKMPVLINSSGTPSRQTEDRTQNQHGRQPYVDRAPNRAGAWEEREPYSKELPCVPVATAPPMLWSMYHAKAGRLYPSGADAVLQQL